MPIVAKVAAAMQAVFGASIDDLARTTRCVQRQRKFSGASLARTLVLTVLLRPAAKNRDFQAMAAKLGVHVTDEAINRRFTNELVMFLEEILKQAVAQALAAKAAATPLLQKFSDVRIGDAKSEIAEVLPPAESLSVFDLGYFSLDRFRRAGEADAYWISRLQHGTKVFDAAGKNLDLQSFVRQRGESGLVDAAVVLGEQDRLACRLIAVRVPAEVASRRRQKVREKARDHGREPSQEYLELQEWTIFVTNCEAELLTWKEVVVAYRARWQIELLFKLWKSHNRMAALETVASPQRQMAVLYVKLIGVIVQHWMLLSAAWSDVERSLRKAAVILRDWIVLLTGVLDDGERLQDFLRRFGAAVTKTARITRRRKHPSLFQLLENPELLDYTLA